MYSDDDNFMAGCLVAAFFIIAVVFAGLLLIAFSHWGLI